MKKKNKNRAKPLIVRRIPPDNENPRSDEPAAIVIFPQNVSSFESAKLEKMIISLNERYELKAMIAKHPNDWLFFAVSRSTDWPVTIQLTHSRKVFEQVGYWKSLVSPSLQVEKIIETGILDTGYYYIVSGISGEKNTVLAANGERMPALNAVRLVRQLCDTLTGLHGCGVNHGEIDPTSIIYVRQGGEVKLQVLRRPFYRNLLGLFLEGRENKNAAIKVGESDYVEFQAAAYPASWIGFNELPPLASRLLREVPLNGWMVACLNPFSAPEIVEGKVSVSSDVYSLGAILYWLLTGEYHVDLQKPFNNKRFFPDLLPDNVNYQHILKLMLESLYLVKLMGGVKKIEKVPFELRGIILKALQAKAADRYASTAAMGEELDHLPLNDLTVKITSNNRAVSGVEVTLTKTAANDRFVIRTGKNGEAVFKELFSGSYGIDAAHPGYISPKRKITTVVPTKKGNEPLKENKIEIPLEPLGLLSRLFGGRKRRW